MGKRLFIYWIIIAAVVILGAILTSGSWAYISAAVTVLTILPAFIRFEKKADSTKTVLLAVMTALSAAGRFVFAPLPGFKPVAAMTIICGMYLGGLYGFMCGSLTAVISNFYFGQGPWTPFQMLAWGSIGLVAGILSSPLKKSRVMLCVFGVIAGMFYSFLMDSWTTLWMDGAWNFSRFAAFVVTAIPTTIEYAVSNCIFLILLAGPIGKKLNRAFLKYGINQY